MTEIMTRPWPDIEFRYEDQDEVVAMLHLVRQIRASPYARGLHAWTSMHDLCIVQLPCTHPYDGPYLRISPLFNGTIEFRFVDTYIEDRQWHRVVREEEAFARLVRFMEQLHWIPRTKSQ